MFTHSSFRALALIAITALGLSGISTVAAEAASSPVNLITSATSITPAGTTATQLVGPANYVTVKNTVVTGSLASAVFFTVSGGTTSSTATSGTIPVGGDIQILCTSVGTITILGYAITSGAASSSPTDTIVITVINGLPGTVYASSRVLAAAGTTKPTGATNSAFSVVAPSGSSKVANFTVAELDSAGNAILAANAKPIAVTVSNGLISSPNLSSSPTANTTYLKATPIKAVTDFVLSGISGQGGVATVTIAVNGVDVKKYSVTFTGAASKILLTPINSVVKIGKAWAILPTSTAPIGVTANVNALEVQEFDSSGHRLALIPTNIRISSSDPAIAVAGAIDTSNHHRLGDIAGGTPTSAQAMGVSINGVSAGNTTFTATDIGQSMSSAPESIRVSNGVPTSVVLSTNFSNYASGAAGTLHTTISNAAGPMPAGTYIVFTGRASSSIVLSAGTSLLPGVPVAVTTAPVQKVGQVTVNNVGVYSSPFNAPIGNATISITATPASSSIEVTPARFDVGTGNPALDVGSPEALLELSSTNGVSDEVVAIIATTAGAVDIAALDAGTKSGIALNSVALLSHVVKIALAKAAVLAAINKKILLKLRTK